MSTQTNPKIDKMFESLVASGLPKQQAMSLVLSIEHSLASESYATQYGTFMVDALNDFLNKVE